MKDALHWWITGLNCASVTAIVVFLAAVIRHVERNKDK